MKRIVRPKHDTHLSYGSNYKCHVRLYPNQKWEFLWEAKDKSLVCLSRYNFTIEMPRKDFDKFFTEFSDECLCMAKKDE